MNLKKTTGINRIIRAWFYSLEGLKAAFSNEAAFRQEICLVIIFGPAGFFMGSTPAEKALLILPLFAVLITEMVLSTKNPPWFNTHNSSRPGIDNIFSGPVPTAISSIIP
jgi:hypothetical protein